MPNKKPPFFSSVLRGRCPRCRRGAMYKQKGIFPVKTLLAMPEECAVCGQKMEPETGFYFGTGYVSYALSIATLVSCFVAYNVLFDFSWKDNSIYKFLALAIGTLVILQPGIMRLSRILYLYLFVKYDPNWKNPSQESFK